MELSFTSKENWIIRTNRTPGKVQQFLRSLPYKKPGGRSTLRSFRGVIRDRELHCLEGALSAATILEQHGYPPLLLDLESQDFLDHVLFLYLCRGRWGSVARSRDAGLHGRKPVYPTVKALVMSYVDPYVDGSGRITGYGILDLCTLRRCDWRLSERNVWAVERALTNIPHKKLRTSNRRYEKSLRDYRAFREKYPFRPVTFYASRPFWL